MAKKQSNSQSVGQSQTEPKEVRRSVFERLIAIPFGRYRRHNGAGAADGSVYIGREGARAYLLEALTGYAKAGAYLVTGRRGVGKSTFVDTIVDEASRLRYRRYMRRLSGRTLLDQLAALIVTVALLGLLVADIEVLSIGRSGESLFSGLPLLIILLTPAVALIFAAGMVSSAILKSLGQPSGGLHNITTLAVLLTMVVAGRQFATAQFLASGLLIATLGLVIVGQLLGRWYLNPTISCLKRTTVAVLALMSVLLIAYSYMWPEIDWVVHQHTFFFERDKLITLDSYQRVWCLIAWLLATLTLGRYVRNANTPKIVVLVVAVSLVAVGLVLFYVDSPLGKSFDTFAAELRFAIGFTTLGVGLLAALGLGVMSDRKISGKASNSLEKSLGRRFVPPVEALLALKALFLLLLATEFAQVYIGVLHDQATTLNGGHTAKGVLATLSQMLPDLPDGSDNSKMYWLATLVALVVVFYLVEFSWITRGFARLRYPPPLDHAQDDDSFISHHLDPTWETKPRKDNRPRTHDNAIRDRHLFRYLDDVTFSGALVNFWVPTISVRINLGFDSLDHRSVIHAMLHGLRREYEKKFLRGANPYRLLGLGTRFLIVSSVVAVLGRNFIDYPYIYKDVNVNTQSTSALENGLDDGPRLHADGTVWHCPTLLARHRLRLKSDEVTLLDPLCMLAPAWVEAVLPIAFMPLVQFPEVPEADAPIINRLLHNNVDLPRRSGDFVSQQYNFTLRLYHLVLFLFLYWISAPFFKRFSLLPYRRRIEQIDDLADSLLTSTRTTHERGKWSLGKLVASFVDQEESEQRHRDPMDSRSVELAFLTLLEELAHSPVIERLRALTLHAPAPDIVFVFDELDKISGQPSPVTTRATADAESFGDERRRSEALHSLLSDMKRLISEAPAHFIFVGNRMLHDEFTADRGKREPLLTSIFDADLYLQSLLIDISQIPDRDSEGRTRLHIPMDDRIRQFLAESHAQALQRQSAQQTDWSSLTHLLGARQSIRRGFVANPRREIDQMQIVNWLFPTTDQIQQHVPGMSNERICAIEAVRDSIAKSLGNEFVAFLAFRSKGLPKKLGDLLSTFVRPMSRLIDSDPEHAISIFHRNNDLRKQRDALVFDHTQVYRTQFVSGLFQQLRVSFEDQLTNRDDKVTIDVLYLFDYILKFHSQAFSWSSLERMDELAHVHRTPDLRQTIASVIDAGVGRYFHPVLNGLFAYRFRTEFAAEVRHLSRLSQEEMASFNFTLDESQELKVAYRALLEQSSQPNEDLMVALGELHENDQEYELARGWYYSALFLNDREYGVHVGETVDVKDELRDGFEKALKTARNPTGDQPNVATWLPEAIGASFAPPERVALLKGILSGDSTARRNIIHHLPWSTRRLRLLLQIGLTYERTYDFERARSYYFAAHSLARALSSTIAERLTKERADQRDITWFSLACDHLEVLYQPAFAAAWIAEKSGASIDSAVVIVELELQEMYANLIEPVIKDGSQQNKLPTLKGLPCDLVDKLFQNFVIVAAEAHNKAGDLYFTKGRSSPLLSGTSKRHNTSIEPRFLPRAARHYSCALLLVRKFVVNRMPEQRSRHEPVPGLPSFLGRLVYSNLVDLAETTLSMACTHTLVDALANDDSMGGFEGEGYFGRLANNAIEGSSITDLVVAARNVSLDVVFDVRKNDVDDTGPLAGLNYFTAIRIDEFDEQQRTMHEEKLYIGDWNLIVRSLLMSTSGAWHAEMSGQRRTALDEYVVVLEIIERISKWISIGLAHRVGSSKTINSERLGLVRDFLGHLALYCIKEVSRLGGSAAHAENSIQSSKVRGTAADERTLVDAATHCCGIMLSLAALTNLSVRCRYDTDRLYALGQNQNTQTLFNDLRKHVSKWFNKDWADDLKGSDLDYSLFDFEYEIESQFIAHSGASKAAAKTRAFARGHLLYLNDRYCYPFLATLQRLKMLADDVYIVDSVIRDLGDRNRWLRRQREADGWTEDLTLGFERFDSATIFPALDLTETTFLKLHAEGLNPDLKPFPRDYDRKLVTLIQISDQSVSMGQKHYTTIRSMFYLYDDFNDRKVHLRHALQMAGAELLNEYLSWTS